MSSQMKNEVQKIMRKKNLTNQEKNRLIQNIYSGKMEKHKAKYQKPILGECPIYPERKCRIIAFCCGELFCCRICHDENSDHLIDRFKTTTIVCKVCETEQKVNSECSSCMIKFDVNFCPKCNLWSSKDIFHCSDCGICRIGIASDYDHCFNCNICCVDDHNCTKVKLSLDESCSICCENLKNSLNSVVSIPCGHYLHRICLLESIDNGNIGCPLCKKSVGNFSEQWNLLREEKKRITIEDPELAKPTKIMCNDCGHQTTVIWHIVGLECPDCNSFNTAKV